MSELLDILDAFTTPLKLAWVIWLAWGIGQVFWYRYERKPRAASAKSSAPSVRRPFVSRPSVPDRVVTSLVTPEEAITHQAGPVAPVVETPDAAADNVAGEASELDRFVANFEMHTRQRSHNGESYDAHPGA